MFGQRDDEKLKNQSERELIRSLTLVERTERQHPCTPNYVTRSSQRAIAPRADLSDSKHPPASPREHSRRLTEFIAEKREIFIFQLQIDRKRDEIKRVYDSISQAETDLIEQEADLEKTALEFKIRSTELSCQLSTATREVEASRRRHAEANQRLRRLRASVDMAKSEIAKNEATLEALTEMNAFLHAISPDDRADPLTVFTRADQLIGEFDRLESSNLRIYEHLMHYQELIDRSRGALAARLAENEGRLAVMADKLAHVPEIGQVEVLTSSTEAQDSELARLGAVIEQLYGRCFKKTSLLVPLQQLASIEMRMDEMFLQLEKVSPQFIREKQIIRDKERRERQRIERQEKQDREQRLKVAQAIERANKPIKKREGRPLVPRVGPVKSEKKNDAKLEAIRREQARVEALLYGELF
jgi:hypothetical protein